MGAIWMPFSPLFIIGLYLAARPYRTCLQNRVSAWRKAGQLAAQHNRNKADCLTGGGGQVKKFPAVSKIAFGKDEFNLNNLLNLR
jgi:hypothetical protein